MGLIENIKAGSYKIALIGGIVLLVIIIIRIIFKDKFSSLKKEDKINKGIKGSNLSKDKDPNGFIFGKENRDYVYLKNDQEGHITIFGGSGKGKTSALLIPSLRAWNGPFFAIDISGDISKNVEGENNKRVILSPNEPDKSSLYNVFYLIDKIHDGEEKREKLEQLVNLIVDIPANTNDTQFYFLNTARKIFLASIIAFYNIGMDFTDICKTVFFNDIKDLANLILKTENKLAKGYIMPLARENEKNIAGAKSTLNDKIKLFADNKKMEQILRRPLTDFDGNTEPCFNPKDLEEKQVFLKIPDKMQEFFAPFMHIVVGQILEYISARVYNNKTDKRILISIDEFASIGHFEILGPFRKFRKNGANLCILTQSLADIDLVYSDKERQVILDNSQYVVVLSANDNNTREYFSNLVGKEDKISTSTSKGRGGGSVSTSIQKDYVIAPEKWKTYDKELIVIHPSGVIKLKKNFYFEN